MIEVWEDMKLYWAWRGPYVWPPQRPPSKKRIEYADLGHMKIACGVWDDDKYTPLNTEEILLRNQQYSV